MIETLTEDEFAAENPNPAQDEFSVTQEELGARGAAFARRSSAYTAALSANPTAAFRQGLSEYNAASTSPTQQEVERSLRDEEAANNVADAERVLQSEASPQEIDGALIDIASRGTEAAPSVREAVVDRLANTEPTISLTEELAHLNGMNHLAEINAGASDLRSLLAETNPTGETGGIAQQSYDLGRLIMAPFNGVRVAQIIDRTLPGIGVDGMDYLKTGDLKLRVQDYFNGLPEQDRKNELRRLAAAILDASDDLFGYNNVEAYDFFDQMFGDLLDDPDTQGINTYLQNFFGLLDFGFGVKAVQQGAQDIIERALGVFKRPPQGAPASVATQVAPRTARAIHMNSEGSQIEALGVDLESLDYEHTAPKPGGTIHRAGHDTDNDFNIRQNRVLNSDFSSAYYHASERRAAQQGYDVARQRHFGSWQDTIHISKTDVTEIPGGYRVGLMIGNTATRGYPLPSQAFAAAHAYREFEAGARTVLMRRNYETGEWEEAFEFDQARREFTQEFRDELNEQLGEGEYMVRIEDEQFYVAEDALATTLRRDDMFQGLTGQYAIHLDKSAIFDEWFVNASNVAADRNSAIVAELTSIMRPLTRLKHDELSTVLAALQKQEDAGKWWDANDLAREFGGNKRLERAFLAHKEHAQAMRGLLNRRFYRQLKGERYETLTINGPEESYQYLARPVESTENIRTAYDPSTGTIVNVTQEMLKELVEDGVNVLETKGVVRKGRHSTNYVLHRPGDGASRMSPLPDQVINEVPGYIPRIYDANFMVAEMVPGTHNGVTVNVTRDGAGNIVSGNRIPRVFARTRADAEAQMELLKAEIEAAAEEAGENVDTSNFVILNSREAQDMFSSYMTRDSIEYYADTGQLFTSGRGDRLRGLQEGDAVGRAGLVDILSAMDAAQTRVARSTTISPFVEVATERWMKAYGAAYGVDGRMPLYGPLNPHPNVDINSEDLAKATTMRDHILMVAGIDDSTVRRWYRGAVQEVSEYYWNAGMPRASEAARAVSEVSIPDHLKKYSFLYHIVASPMRQLYLQANQATMYLATEGAGDYMRRRNGYFADNYGLLTRMLTPRTDPDSPKVMQIANEVLTELGGSSEEADAIYDALLRTGILQSTDTHGYHLQFSTNGAIDQSFLRGNFERAAPDAGSLRVAGQSAMNAARGLAAITRRLGFDAGERFQLAQAFLFERNKWIQENPEIAANWADDTNLATIAGRARARSGNMNSSGALGFQRDWAGLIFQFMSHTAKMVQIALPGEIAGRQIPGLNKISNKFYTNAERRRLLIGQGILYGGGGLGIAGLGQTVVDYASEKYGEPIDVPEDVEMVAREGLTGTLINLMARAANDEELFSLESRDGELATDVIVSQATAPMSGITGLVPDPRTMDANPLVKLIEASTSFNYSGLAEFATGPASSIIENLGDRGRTVMAIAGFTGGIKDNLVNNPEEAMPIMLDEMARILPWYNRWYQARAVDRIGRFRLNSGAYGVQATEAEGFLRSTLGFRTQREAEINDYIYDQTGLRREIMPPSDNDLQEIANNVADRILSYATRFAEDEYDADRFAELVSYEHFTYQFILEHPDKIDFVHRRVQDRLNRLTESGRGGEENGYGRLYQILESKTTGEYTIMDLDKAIIEIQAMPPFPGKQSYIEMWQELQRELSK